MEITTGKLNKIVIDVPTFDEAEFDFECGTKFLPNYKFDSFDQEYRNYSAVIYHRNSNNKLATFGGSAVCHEIIIRGFKNPSCNQLMIGPWNKDLLQTATQRVVNVFGLLNEENNWEDLPDFSHIKHESTGYYYIMMDFSHCPQYFDSLIKVQLILRLIRWSLVCENETPTFESLIKSASLIESNQSVTTTLGRKKDNLLYLFRNFNVVNRIKSFEHNYLFELEPITFNKAVKKVKSIKYYPLSLISRHPTHSPLSGLQVEKPAVVRFGILRDEKKAANIDNKLVINSLGAVKNSASKFLMKRCFEIARVKTAEYSIPENIEQLTQWLSKFGKDEQKFIIKSEFGSRGVGLWLIQNKQQAIEWFQGREMNGKKRLGNYIIERYYNYNKEYRLHISKEGCFYTNRKMLKSDAQERWFRNDSNSVWILEENPKFEKPKNWKTIVSECVKALNAVGLDLGACDVRVQSKSDTPDFIICEINSAPSFGETTLIKYQNEIQRLCADS